MKVRITKANPKPNSLETFCLALSLAGVSYMVWAWSHLSTSANPPTPRGFIGPFCGGTRAVGCILQGRWFDALVFSPLALLFVAVIGGIAAHYLILVVGAKRRIALDLGQRGQWLLFALALLALTLGWAYALNSGAYLVPFSEAAR